MDKIGLYVHWPYCARICPYCDFNVYKAKSTDKALVDAILKDIEHTYTLTGTRQLESIHFGGGTPSLMRPSDIARIVALATGQWSPSSSLEIGLEANPNDITTESLKNWQAAGIERLSIGVQSFDDAALRFLGRDHDGGHAKRALDLSLQTLPRVSCDLIFGLKGQGLGAWQADIENALASGAPHISAYQLTVKPGTAFAKAAMRGDQKSINDDNSADYYAYARDQFLGAGFAHYEVSNYAKTDADRSRHNLLYWQGADYVGVGPGAHGRITLESQRLATVCAMKPADYMETVKRTGSGITEKEVLSPHDVANEYVMMGLRCADGISLSRYQFLNGQALNPVALEEQIALGHLLKDGDTVRATEAGFLLLDAVSLALLS